MALLTSNGLRAKWLGKDRWLSNNALDRNLDAPEFAAFLRRVHAAPVDAKRDALELCIYMGGQRPTQLSRLRRSDINLSAGTITLYDPKGKRRQPRARVL